LRPQLKRDPLGGYKVRLWPTTPLKTRATAPRPQDSGGLSSSSWWSL